MERITKNFTLDELIVSSTAARLHIDNEPSEQEKMNLISLAKNILQPIRDAWQEPIIVTSGFRSKQLNKAVGGVANSQHMLGEAADITVGGKERNKRLFNIILKLIHNKSIVVGQLIDEKNYSWIHVSLPMEGRLPNDVLHLK